MNKINPKLNLFLQNVYSYDISSCHYVILKNLGYDVSSIDETNKEKRNIKIGLMMKENSRVAEVLRETTNNLISEYFVRNEIKDNDIVIRLYDGFISTRKLWETSKYIQLELRCIYQTFLASIDRLKYIALDLDNNVTIKGVANRYKAMDDIFSEIIRINYNNKKVIFKSLQEIKDKIMYSDDVNLYAIPVREKYCSIFFKKLGQLPITSSSIGIIDANDIDKEKYFNMYIKPFTQSISLVFK
jgi:hypothetical protein